MITETRDRKVESTIEGESIFMSVDPMQMGHIMEIMTDLYSNAELAVLREYSTNAYDAHIEAGITRPIEVTLPTALSPYLKIKDYGFGLDTEDIRDIYSKYGASTKRSSNDVVGMLGLGCKSALTYTDQFTVTAVKNGIKTEVVVSRTEDNRGKMTPVDQYATDEPSGVEIIIPAKAHNTFNATAEEFFSYWQSGTVLVNDKEPKRIDGFWIADDLLVIEESGSNKIVMGNVAYPIPESEAGYSKSYSIIAFVPIGSVNFVPSREALQLNSKTKATIAEVLERVANESANAITRQVETAINRREALMIYVKTRNIFGRYFKADTVTYKGKEIPAASDAPQGKGKTIQEFVVVQPTVRKSYRSKGWGRMSAIPSTIFHKVYWITGYNGTDFSPYKRKKLDQWLSEKGLNNPDESFVFTSIVPNRTWIDPKTIFPWSEIDAQKIVREATTKRNGTVSGSYTAWEDGVVSIGLLAKDIDTSKLLLYNNTTYYHVSHDAHKLVKDETGMSYTLIDLSQNRIAKFKRDFPMAIELREWCKAQAEAWKQSLTEDDLHYLATRSNDNSDLMRLKGMKFDDPELSKAIETVCISNKDLVSKYNVLKSYVTFDREWTNPLENYPLYETLRLYGTMGQTMQEHLTLYFNAAYAARQEEAS